MSNRLAPPRTVVWLAAEGGAFLAGVAALISNVVIGDDTINRRQAQCEHMFQPITARMPWYAVPLAIVACLLFVVCGALVLLAARRGGPRLPTVRTPLIILVALALLFSLWFGVYGTIVDTSIDPPRCVG